jgi:hypothetical protein
LEEQSNQARWKNPWPDPEVKGNWNWNNLSDSEIDVISIQSEFTLLRPESEYQQHRVERLDEKIRAAQDDWALTTIWNALIGESYWTLLLRRNEIIIKAGQEEAGTFDGDPNFHQASRQQDRTDAGVALDLVTTTAMIVIPPAVKFAMTAQAVRLEAGSIIMLRAETATIDVFTADVAAPTSVAESTRALTVGSKVKLRINSAGYSASERQMIQAVIDETNVRIAGGAETSVVGQQVPFSSYKSRVYIRDRFFPDKPVSQVKVGDANEIMGFTVNVDEIVPRQIGGRQVFENQRVLSESLNKALGPIEERGLRNQPAGMRVQGFYIEWY